jgi:hypothetical protein
MHCTAYSKQLSSNRTSVYGNGSICCDNISCSVIGRYSK